MSLNYRHSALYPSHSSNDANAPSMGRSASHDATGQGQRVASASQQAYRSHSHQQSQQYYTQAQQQQMNGALPPGRQQLADWRGEQQQQPRQQVQQVQQQQPRQQQFQSRIAERQQQPLPPAPAPPQNDDGQNNFFVQALYPFDGTDTGSISFQDGDMIEVLSTLDTGWWDGVLVAHPERGRGWFPSNFVRRVYEGEEVFERAFVTMQAWWASQRADDSPDPGQDEWGQQLQQHQQQRPALSRHASSSRFVPEQVQEVDEEYEEELLRSADDDITTFSTGGDIFKQIAEEEEAQALQQQREHQRTLSGGSGMTQRPSQQHHAFGVPEDGMEDDEVDDGEGRVPAAAEGSDDEDRGAQADEEDYWLPQMTNDGQIYYFNTETGETVKDLGQIETRANGTTAASPKRRDRVGELASASNGINRLSMGTTGSGGSLPAETIRDLPLTATSGASIFSNETERGGPASSSHATTAVPTPSTVDPVPEEAAPAAEDRRDSIAESSQSRNSVLDESDVDAERPARREGKGKAPQPPLTLGELRDSLALKGPLSFAELEGQAARAFRELFEGVGGSNVVVPSPTTSDGGAADGQPAIQSVLTLREGLDTAGYEQDRARLASLADEVVRTVRDLMHASGVLEGTARANTPANLAAVRSLAILPPQAVVELRPFSRKCISRLSKLILSVRAVWGILETTVEDHAMEDDVLEPTSPGSPIDMSPEAIARRAQIRQAIVEHRAMVRARRRQDEIKLRTEVLNELRALQEGIDAFLENVKRVIGPLAAASLSPTVGRAPVEPTLEELKSIKPTDGQLVMSAADFDIPGGPPAANWRGSGFVHGAVQGSPIARADSPHVSRVPPSRLINAESAAEIEFQSTMVVEEVESMVIYINSLVAPTRTGSAAPSSRPRSSSNGSYSRASTISSRRQGSQSSLHRLSIDSTSDLSALSSQELPSMTLVTRAGRLIGRLAQFIDMVEDVDVAYSIDYEDGNALPPTGMNREPRGSLRSLNVPSSVSGSDTASITDSPHQGSEMEAATPGGAAERTPEQKALVQDARSLLVTLDAAKQALYDASPLLMAALQDLVSTPVDTIDSLEGKVFEHGPHPWGRSPMMFYDPPSRKQVGPVSLLRALIDLKMAIREVCSTFSSLAQIGDQQSGGARSSRKLNIAFRSSIFDDGSIASVEPQRQLSGGALARMSVSGISMSPASSRFSFRQGEDGDQASSGRDSESHEGDHYAGTVTTAGTSFSSAPSKGGSRKMPFPLSIGTNKRESVMTMGSSNASDPALRGQQDVYGRRPSEPSSLRDGLADSPDMTSPAKSKIKLAKLLGTDIPPSGAARASSEPEAPIWLGSDYVPGEISFGEGNSIRGGTLRALVIALTNHEGRVDSSYLTSFMLTYRTFCKSHELLDQLSDRWMLERPQGLAEEQMHTWETRKQRIVRARVANVLKSWVREHMDQEDLDPDLLRRIADFAANVMRDPAQSPQIIKAVEDRLTGQNPRTAGNLAPGSVPAPVTPRNMKKMKLLDIDPLELARQLTLMDCRLFVKITPEECLHKAWSKKFPGGSPNISRMIEHNNQITRWVAATILEQGDLKKRAGMMRHWIFVAERCWELKSLSTTVAIVVGLNSTPIHRLRRTWETVSAKHLVPLNDIKDMVKSERNYAAYRAFMRVQTPPCIPFLGVYLTDLVFFGDGNSDVLRDGKVERPGQINFVKRQKTSEVVLNIKLFQTLLHNLAAVPPIQQFIAANLARVDIRDPAADDARMYEVSLTLEPRERDDEKIARLLSESGFL